MYRHNLSSICYKADELPKESSNLLNNCSDRIHKHDIKKRLSSHKSSKYLENEEKYMEYMHNIHNYEKLKMINPNFNRRKFFRLELRNTECSKLSIVEINGKKIETKYANVRIMDIGPSGLAFISKLEFPNDKNILFKFTTKILNKTIEVKGNIVRKDKYEDSGIFRYGVKLKMDKNDEIKYKELLKNILTESRKLNKYNYYYTPLNKLQI